jgi:NAD(P)-dependent dehydrogenase (short-subunit alcohol dehydrogenase family)
MVMRPFTEKVVIITGGGSGIGRGAALLFGQEGARVAVIDWDESSARETLRLLECQGVEGQCLRADVSKSHEVENAVQAAVSRFGRIDVLFANAATQISKSGAETTEDEWDRLQAVNVKGVFLCCKHVIPIMQRQRRGSIVISASGHAFVTYPNCSAYAATKGGVLALMRGLALDYAADGIRVNCVIPGATDTALLRNYINGCPDPKSEELRIINRVPLKRFATPEDIARGVCFLASDEASYITGTWLAVDGGLLAQG